MSVAGTTPPGTADSREASAWVQRMFAGIAPRYDLLNHLFSFNIDRGWRKVLMQRLMPVLQRQDARVADLCCGTGDVLLDLQRVAAVPIIGVDFCHPMLLAAAAKMRKRGYPPMLIEGDALHLPFRDASLDAVSIAFGFRNLVSYSGGLKELHRVLKPEGMLAILEFSHPPGAFMRAAYGFYSETLLPAAGALLSGSREAYAYLPASVRKFPGADELRDMMLHEGFAGASYELLTGGIAALHMASKPPC